MWTQSRKCRREKMKPRNTVAASHFRLDDFFPFFAEETAPSIVKLLVSSTAVMTTAFRMLGKNGNDRGQSGVPTRRYEDPNRTPPKVTASEAMKSPIGNFLD